jgi:hypothetical protein
VKSSTSLVFLKVPPPLFSMTEFVKIGIQQCNIIMTAPSSTTLGDLKSIRGDERVSVNKACPASPQLTARSGQSAQLVQCTHCIRTHVNLHSDFGHPSNGTRITWSLHDFIQWAKEIPRAFVYVDSLVSANGL